MAYRSGLTAAWNRLPRDRRRRRLVPSCERLETLCLLSNASPVISGYVFADTNNDGHFEAGESPVAGTKVELLNASGAVVGTTLTGKNGSYAFATDTTVSTATQSITQTLTLPAAYTNLDGAAFSSALKLFDPSLGTLVNVKVSSVVTVSTTLQGENTSRSDTADISGSISGSDEIDGLSGPISGTVAASTPVFHASVYDGTLDYAGTSGVTFQLAPTDSQTATLTGASDLAFYTASAGRPAITPTATIHASLVENASSGNTQYQAATMGSAVVTVTYDYTPSDALQPGAYTIVPFPTSTFAEGKASSQTGQVVTTPSGGREIVVNLSASGSSQNDFGLLPALGALSVPTSKPVTVAAPVVHKPVVKAPVVHKPVAPTSIAPVHPTGFLASTTRFGFVFV